MFFDTLASPPEWGRGELSSRFILAVLTYLFRYVEDHWISGNQYCKLATIFSVCGGSALPFRYVGNVHKKQKCKLSF